MARAAKKVAVAAAVTRDVPKDVLAASIASVQSAAIVHEDELRDIVKLRKDLADLASTVRATKQTLEIKEAELIKRLRAGAKVEGRLVAIVEMVKGRISVSWKDVAMKFAVKLGLNPVAVEKEEKAEKEKTLVPEPTLVITGDAVEQYVGDRVGQ